MSDARVPVVVITGFLGAGKTTLVNRILASDHGRRFAVLVNEFGEIGIDHALIRTTDEQLIELNNGCLCCVLRGDLIVELRALLRREPRLDGVIIETTGLADPGPVIQTFFADQTLMALARLASVTTVVDALRLRERLADVAEAARQVGFADQIVLNKVDAVAAGALADVEADIRRINPTAPIVRARYCDVGVDTLLQRRAFDLARIAEALNAGRVHGGEGVDHPHPGGHDVASVALSSTRAFAHERLERWLEDLLARHGQDIFRAKGVIRVAGEPRKLAFQSVNRVLEGEYLGEWGADEPRLSRIVFIGRALDANALRRGFFACAADAGKAPDPGRAEARPVLE